MEIQFFIPMKLPTITHQQKQVHVKNGKPVFYEPDKLKDARQKFMAHLGQHVPKQKMTGPVQLVTKWYYTNSKKENGKYKTTKPDTDNMVKLVKDVMTDLGYWQDDAQVASEFIEKLWGIVPGLYVYIKELDNEQNQIK